MQQNKGLAMNMFGESGNGLSAVVVKKKELLEALVKNHASHRKEYIAAEIGYRKAVIEALEKLVVDAKEGREIQTHVALVAPHDHSKEYVKVIAMLNMSVKDEVEVTETEFSQFVLDDWAWKQQFASTNAMYNRR